MNAIVRDLLGSTQASCATLQLDLPAFDFHIDVIMAEACSKEFRLKADRPLLEQRDLAVVRWLEAKQDILVQADCVHATPASPRAALQAYGTTAQMLGPVLRNRRVMGIISVYETRGIRCWSESDKDALRVAMSKAQAVLNWRA